MIRQVDILIKVMRITGKIVVDRNNRELFKCTWEYLDYIDMIPASPFRHWQRVLFQSLLWDDRFSSWEPKGDMGILERKLQRTYVLRSDAEIPQFDDIDFLEYFTSSEQEVFFAADVKRHFGMNDSQYEKFVKKLIAKEFLEKRHVGFDYPDMRRGRLGLMITAAGIEYLEWFDRLNQKWKERVNQ